VNYSVSLGFDEKVIPTSAKCNTVSVSTKIAPGGVYVAFPKDSTFPFRSAVESEIGSVLQTQLVTIVETEMRNLTNVNLTIALEKIAANIEPGMVPGSIPAPPQPPPDSVNLMDAWPMSIADFLIDKLIGANGTNLIMDLLTGGTGDLSLPNKLINLTKASVNVSLPGLANLKIGLLDFELGGLNTWTQLELLQVNGPTSAVSRTAMDRLFVNITAYINVSTSSGPLMSTPLYEEFAFVLDLRNMSLQALTEIAFNRTEVKRLGNAALGSTFGCTFKELMNFQTSYLHMDVGNESISLNPRGGDIEDDIDSLINHVLTLFLTSYNAGIPSVLTALVTEPLTNAIDTAVIKARNKSTCVASPAMVHADLKEEEHDLLKGEIFSSVWLCLTLLFAAVAICWTVEPVGHQRSTECIDMCSGPKRTSSYGDYDDDSLLDIRKAGINGTSMDDDVMPHEDSRGDPTTPMLLDGRIPLWARVGVISALLFNVFLFISSNTTTGASAYVAVTIDGDVLQSPAVFSFSLVNTIQDMWTANCIPLSIIVALFSGAWPYGKLLCMILCWLLPGRALSHRWRMRLMQATDAIGKWSLLDSFLLIVFMVAFRLHLEGTLPASTEFQEVTDIAIDVAVSPEWGLYGYLAATCLSLVLNHFVVHYMRVVDEPEHPAPLSEKKVALSRFTHLHNGRSLAFRGRGRVLVSALLLGSLLLFLAGLFVEAFNFEFLGVAGWAIDPTLHGKNIRHFSVVGLYEQLAASPMFITEAGLGYIRLAFLMFTVVFPLAQLLLLQVLWLVPLSEAMQWRALVTAEIFNAWQAVDVFALAIIASLLEIRQFAAFLIGDKADVLNPFLKKYFDKPLQGDDKVFDVIATLTEGCWLLVASTVIQFLVGSAVLALCGSALHQQAAVRNGRQKDSSSKILSIFVKCFPSIFTESSGLIDNDSALLNEHRA
jgi:hypothetical protein